MARAIEVPVVAKKGTLARSIEGEAATAFRNLGRSSGAVAPLGRMLGKIRGDADEFTKSIEASNARVIAFGASVGVINGISNAFKELVRVTVNVEKSLTDINVVLNANETQLAKFGDGLFKVAKNTAQSFDVVAEAATEFARQGLSLDETLKRTNDALILTRLTGLKAAESVKGLTAATNGFAKAGLDTTQIINKLAAVDVKFAVSADDLIAALSRTGAVAQDAGLSIDELIGMVTAAQQVTARGGPVIGNAFKTIFTRVQRPETLNTLRELKIAVEDASGAALPASKVLQNLASSYNGLSRSAKDAVNQQVAGVFQINILKAAVGDLQKQNSLAARATAVSAGATDQAAKKNEMLNQTIAALTTQTGLALTELAKKIGDISLAPGMRDLVASFKGVVEGTTGVLDGEGTGSDFARGLLKGIGNVLTGPGLIVIGGVFIKLFKDLTVFGMSSLKNLLGLNNAAKQQAALQSGIGTLLQTNTAYQTQMAAAAGNVNKQAAITQRFLAQEIAMRQQAAALTSGMAGAAFMGGFRVDKAGDLTKKSRMFGGRGKVPGFAPNFAPGDINNGVLDIGKTFPVASAEVMPGIGGRQNYSISQFLKSLDKAKPGQARMKDNLKQWFGKNGVTAISADFQLAPGAAVSAKDVGSFIDRTYGGTDGMKIGQDKLGAKYNSILSAARSLATTEGTALHGRPISAFTRALNDAGISRGAKTSLETLMNRGPVEAELVRRIGGSGKGLGGDFIVDAIGADGMPTEVKNRLIENKAKKGGPESFNKHGGNIGGALFKSFRAKAPLYDMFSGDKLGRNIQADLKGSQSKFLGSIGEDAPQHMRPKAGGRGAFGRGGRFFSMFRGAPGFAPIADAIQREKHQVGGLLGINPSQVKTKVIQNTALRSSFNPGGFGVISPTIGQKNFADAARMHKGEDLRTANLPNFAKIRKSRKAAGDAEIEDLVDMIMGKGATTTETGHSKAREVVVSGIKDEPAKKLGRETARELPKAMDRGLKRDSMLAKTKEIAATKELEKQAKAASRPGMGGLAMNTFMAYSAGTMLGGMDKQIEDLLGLGRGRGAGAATGAVTGGYLGGVGGAALGRRFGKRGGLAGGLIGTAAGTFSGAFLGGMGLEDLADYLTSGGVMDASIDLPGIGNVGIPIPQLPKQGPRDFMRERDEGKEVFRATQRRNLERDLAEMTAINRRVQRLPDQLEVGVGYGGSLPQEGLSVSGDFMRRSATVGRGFVSDTSVAARRARIRRERLVVAQGAQRGALTADFGKQALESFGAANPAVGGTEGMEFRNIINEAIKQGRFEQLQGVIDTLQSTGSIGPGGAEVTSKNARSRGGSMLNQLANDLKTANLEFDRKAGIPKSVLDAGTSGGDEFLQDLQQFPASQGGQAFAKTIREGADALKELQEGMDDARKIDLVTAEIEKFNAEMKNVDQVVGTMNTSLGQAFSDITTGSSSVGGAFRNMAISILGSINQIASQNVASEIMSVIMPAGGKGESFLKSILNRQSGGIIKAQNGMYISGGRTGDKNPAMLEDGEYVLNRNAVKALGGPSAIDGLNFGVAPRFQSGGRLASPIASAGVRSSSLNKIIEKNEFLPPMAGMGTALGGGGSSVRLGITDPRLSGFAHANDPVLQNVRADVQKYHERQRQKKFEKQAKKDQLIETIVGAIVSVGVAKGVQFGKGKLQAAKIKRQQDFTSGIMGIDTGPGFIGPMPAPAGAAAEPVLDMAAMSADFADPLNPPGGPLIHRTSAGKIHTQKSFGKFVNQSTNFRSAANIMFEGGSFSKAYKEALSGRIGVHRSSGERVTSLESMGAEMAKIRKMFGGVKQPSKSQIGQYYLLKAEQAEKRGGIPGIQSGGYIDNIPAMLTGGEFVVNPSTVRRHGSAFFNKLNRGGRIGYQTGGLVGDQQFVPAQGDTQNNNNNKTQNENNATSNTTINITVNGSSGESNSDGENAGTEQRQMATQLQDAVLTVLKQQKRTGGMLRDVTSNDQ